MTINAVTTGNLGSDPELKYTNDGTPVLNFSVASNDGWGDNKTTTWVRAAVFGKRAEALSKILAKGRKVQVVGPIVQREYDRREGGKGYSLDQRANDVELLDSTPEHQSSAPPPSNQAQRPSNGSQQAQGRKLPF